MHLCAGCVDVCPEACLKLVPVEALQGDANLEELIRNRYGELPLDRATAIVKDETLCIRCGLCAERCPVDAITMERFGFKEAFCA